MSIYVDHPYGPLVVHPYGPPRRHGGYGRVPLEVLGDPNLKPRDICVYAAISSPIREGVYSCIGTRLISEICGLNRKLVLASILKLEERGHLRREGASQRGRRTGYFMTSPVFGQKQGKADVIRYGKRTKRLVSVDLERIA